jgi:predicted signal transduction protein with EAL and GGDEF domain
VVARLGGDEFLVVQTYLTEPSGAGVLAAKLVTDLGRKYVLGNQEVQSGASIGIAVYPGDAEESEELIKRADLALYDAKRRGRFNYQFYRDELGHAHREAQMTTLPSLERFPLDAVKPDQALVRKPSSNGRETALLAAIISVAHNLKIAVCAAGVETTSQLAAMKEQGCDSAQGYLLKVPLDADAMGRLVETELAQ